MTSENEEFIILDVSSSDDVILFVTKIDCFSEYEFDVYNTHKLEEAKKFTEEECIASLDPESDIIIKSEEDWCEGTFVEDLESGANFI